jgi:hypothetical protein
MDDAPVVPDGPPIIYYDDAVAQGLAERMVALAAMDTTQSVAARDFLRALPGFAAAGLTARQLSQDEGKRRLERGEGFAFVTSVRNPVPDTCGSARKLLRRAPWLVSGGKPIAESMVPLVDTRSFAILTGRSVFATYDYYGTVHVRGWLAVIN